MTNIINTYSGAAGIQFGMSRIDVRKILGEEIKSFKRTTESQTECDYSSNKGIFVYYKTSDLVEALEFTRSASVEYGGLNLLEATYFELKAFFKEIDADLEIESDSITSYLTGISIYIPDSDHNSNAKAESILVFEKGYFDV